MNDKKTKIDYYGTHIFFTLGARQNTVFAQFAHVLGIPELYLLLTLHTFMQ